MPRTREFDPDQALEQALALFWQRGFADTSMEDLVEATGVSRYGLYGAFGNKRELFEKALRRYWQWMSTQMFPDLYEPDASLPQIHAYLARMPELAHNEHGRHGCLMCNTAVEMAGQDPAMAEVVRDLLEGERQLLAKVLANAVRKKELAETTDVEALATFYVATSMGLAVMMRAGFPLEVLRGGLRTAAKAVGVPPE